MYVIVRSDLSAGAQAAQALHAAIQFCLDYPEMVKYWNKISNYICLLQISSEEELFKLTERIKNLNLIYAEFKEPDLNNSLTAICLAPGALAKKLVQKLKLALNK